MEIEKEYLGNRTGECDDVGCSGVLSEEDRAARLPARGQDVPMIMAPADRACS